MTTEVRARFVERTACIACRGTRLRELSSGGFDQGAVGAFIDADPWGEHPGPFLAGQRWSFVECADCTTTFHRYILDPQWSDRRFERWMSHAAIEAFEADFDTPDRRFAAGRAYVAGALGIEKLTRSARSGSELRLLDFGCGYGGFLSVCAALGFMAVGVDRATAKREHGSYARTYETLDEVEHLAPFHAVTLFEVLEHLDEPLDALQRLRTLLDTDGLLVLETPDCTGVHDIRSREDYERIHPLDHINGFNPKTLTGIAQRAGFQPVAKPLCVVTAGPSQTAKAIARHALGPLLQRSTQLLFRKA